MLAKRKDKEEGLGGNDNAIPFNKQNFEQLRRECLESGKLFCDPKFPAESRSLGYNQLGRYSSKTSGVEWKRPSVRILPVCDGCFVRLKCFSYANDTALVFLSGGE